jgi:tripartite-type tricarboxylate transporter receptor subunit TctC
MAENRQQMARSQIARSLQGKLQSEVAKAGWPPDMQETFTQLGITMTSSTPEELASFIETETAKWAQIIRETGIKAE